MAIHSANASTVALAELIAGSEANFVNMMNEKAAELGLKEGTYYFVNSSGLNNSDMLGNHPEGTDVNAENMMAARAVAKLAYHFTERLSGSTGDGQANRSFSSVMEERIKTLILCFRD